MFFRNNKEKGFQDPVPLFLSSFPPAGILLMLSCCSCCVYSTTTLVLMHETLWHHQRRVIDSVCVCVTVRTGRRIRWGRERDEETMHEERERKKVRETRNTCSTSKELEMNENESWGWTHTRIWGVERRPKGIRKDNRQMVWRESNERNLILFPNHYIWRLR